MALKGVKKKLPAWEIYMNSHIEPKVDTHGIEYKVWKGLEKVEKVTHNDIKKRVWLANTDPAVYFELFKFHFPGEPMWPIGGVTLRDGDGNKRYFLVEEVRIHPTLLKIPSKLTVKKAKNTKEVTGAVKLKKSVKIDKKPVKKKVKKADTQPVINKSKSKSYVKKASKKSPTKRGKK